MSESVSVDAGADSQPILVIHGGAGHRSAALSALSDEQAHAGLRAALEAGYAVLQQGGTSDEAVIAAVCELEDAPSFNAGRGAALTQEGTAEMDACVMNGEGRSGAVAGITCAKHPVRAAAAVRDKTPHLIMANPTPTQLKAWNVETADPDYFVTEPRKAELNAFMDRPEPRFQHGTVGAVARDAAGHLAAATSTGGIVGQMPGRLGDTPVPGAGTYADNDTVAVSCTGSGEMFLAQMAARAVHEEVQAGRATAVAVDTVLDRVKRGDGMGGIIAVPATGPANISYNSGCMYYGTADATGLKTHV